MSNRLEGSSRCSPRRLDGAPLEYEPQNELGVVFLFSELARKQFGLRIDKIQAGFPDCIASRDNEIVRIEFEYRARSFATHKHDPMGCDWIVCWIDDWPGKPDHLKVVELRKYYGLGFNVWLYPVGEDYWERLSRMRFDRSWTVASQASKGDLVLFYRVAPCACISDIFRISGPVTVERGGDWNQRPKDWFAPVRRVCSLKTPLYLKEIKQNQMLKNAGFVRRSLQGRPRVTPHWPWLLEMIVDRNPSLRRTLGRYGADRT